MTASGATRAYIEFFQTLTEESLDGLEAVFVNDVHFRDPFNDVHSRAEVEAIFHSMFATCTDIEFTITDACQDARRAFLHWQMHLSPRSRLAGSRPWQIEGTSRVLFAEDGRVREHLDFWDSGMDFYARLPILGGAIRAIRRRMG